MSSACSTGVRVARFSRPGKPSILRTSHCIPGARRPISAWQPVPQLESPSVEVFRQHAFRPGKPVKLARGSVAGVDARGTWLTASTPATLNTAYLEQFASTLHLPMELSMPCRDVEFHRVEAAPLSFFLDAWHAYEREDGGSQQQKRKSPAGKQDQQQQQPRFYIAQSPLNLLPDALAAAFPTPDVVVHVGAGDVYGSSLWLGRAPTATPLHRDPNPNVLVQVAGRKIVRLVEPQLGSRIYAWTREAQGMAGNPDSGGGGGGFGAEERIRGEGMMKGREKVLLEGSVWGDGDDVGGGDGDGVNGAHGEGAASWMDGLKYEAILEGGDALFIPLGWWHAVRGAGKGVNMSVNWWFR